MMENLSLNENIDYFESPDMNMLSTLYLRHIYTRIHSYKHNFLGMITGKHRVGKSLTALSFAHCLDKTFMPNLEERVVFFPDDFMNALQKIKKQNIIGGAIIWDEAGVGIPAREWYNISNKAINYTLQVFGRYRPIVYFVTHDIRYIDSQIRKLFHGFYEMSRFKNKYATAKPFNVSYNKRNGKVYWIYPRLYMKHDDDSYGVQLKLKKINVLRPFKELEDTYEFHSKIFKDKIVEQMQERSENFRDGNINKKRMTIKEIIDTIVEHKDNPVYLSKRSKEDAIIFDKDSIRVEFDIPDSQARHVKKMAEIKVNAIPEDEHILDEIPDDE